MVTIATNDAPQVVAANAKDYLPSFLHVDAPGQPFVMELQNDEASLPNREGAVFNKQNLRDLAKQLMLSVTEPLPSDSFYKRYAYMKIKLFAQPDETVSEILEMAQQGKLDEQILLSLTNDLLRLDKDNKRRLLKLVPDRVKLMLIHSLVNDIDSEEEIEEWLSEATIIVRSASSFEQLFQHHLLFDMLFNHGRIDEARSILTEVWESHSNLHNSFNQVSVSPKAVKRKGSQEHLRYLCIRRPRNIDQVDRVDGLP